MNSPIRIEMLGRLTLTARGETITRFRTQRTAALLARLASRLGRSNTREHLAELLWPESEPETSRLNLRVALNSLRRIMEPPDVRSGSILIADRISVRLNPEAVAADADEFESALRNPGATTHDARVSRLKAACSLYQGDFLPGFYDDWIVAERERLARLRLEAAEELATTLIGRGEHQEALEYALVCANEQPFEDAANERLIGLLIRLGRTVEAARHFQRFKERLEHELGLAPSKELEGMGALLPEPPPLPAAEPEAKELPKSVEEASLVEPNPSSSAFLRLPLRLTRFFGREAELERLTTLLESNAAPGRLITITGLGGSGKTRLSIEAAEQAVDHFPGGLWFVDLAGLADPSLVGASISSVVAPRPKPGSDLIQHIANVMANEPCLLLLDNMEQLLPAHPQEPSPAVEAICRLLALAPNLKCLVTSRRRLGVEGERELRLTALQLPEYGSTPKELARVASVAMFVDRARHVQPDFTVTARSADAIIQICRRLEGLPLALELAAAWAHSLSPSQMTERLSGSGSILVSRRRGGPARHQSLRTALGESLEQLPGEHLDFLGALSVFRGGFTVEAANAVGDAQDSLTLLVDLQERSLVETSTDPQASRFRLLETVREFAGDRLPSERRSELDQRHAAWFQSIAEEGCACIRTRRQADWIPRLTAEKDNLRAALGWLLVHDPPRCASLTIPLCKLWEITWRDAEARNWLDQLIDLPGLEPLTRAAARISLARFYTRAGNVALAAPLLEAALEGISADAPQLEAQVRYCRAWALAGQGRYPEASAAYREAQSRFEAAGARSNVADCLLNVAELEAREGRTEDAVRIWNEALEVSEEIGDARNVAVLCGNKAELAMKTGRFAEALPLLRKALSAAEECGDLFWQGVIWQNLGQSWIWRGDLVEARRSAVKAQELFREIQADDLVLLAEGLLAELDRENGNSASAEERCRAVFLRGDASRMRNSSDPMTHEILAYQVLIRLEIDRCEYAKAAELIDRCLKSDPGSEHAVHFLAGAEAAALCLAATGARDEARSLAVEALQIRASTDLVRHPADEIYFERLQSLCGRLEARAAKRPGEETLTAALRALLVRTLDACRILAARRA